MSHDDPRSGADSPSPGRSPSPERLVTDEASPQFDHTPEGADPHHHIALLYATQAEQFAAVVPFVRDGLERGERCLYIYDENTREAVVAAMREAGIDVDAAVEAGDLSFHMKADSFLQDGTFDPDETIDFAIETVREAIEDEGYDGVRVSGEMTWVLDGDHNLEQMIEYEHRLNTVFGERDVVGLCQYDVTRFDPEIVNHIVRAHPNLIYGGSASRDFYYVPSELFDGVGSVDTTDDPESFFERVRAHETLQQREEGLRALNEAAGELMSLDTAGIADRAPDLVRNVLDVTFASFWAYDAQSGDLERHSSSTAEANVTALADLYADRAWDAFVTERTDVRNDLSPPAGFDESGPTLRSGVIVPLGRHGVFCAGATRPNVFDEPTVDLATTVGATIEAALDRADREQALETHKDELERLNRINSVIREIDEALVDADSRVEIERLVCDRLAAFDPYAFVWIGERDLETGTVTPRAQAGDHGEYLESVTITTDDAPTGQGPVTTALDTRDVQVVQDVLTDSTFKPWREVTLSHGFRGCLSVPLVYGESVYGVLTLYMGSPNAFDEQEGAVLAELGETIAHAIDAAETKRTMRTDSVTELTLDGQDVDDVLAHLARETGCELDFSGLVPRTDGPARLFFTTRGVPADEVLAGADHVPGVAALQAIQDDESECVFEATVTAPTLASTIVAQHGLVRSLTVTDDSVTVAVDLPADRDVRAFVDAVRAAYPSMDLVARHARDRSITTRGDLRAVVADRFTARQREILEMAYLSGFFESPRARTGTELADALDISQSTFTYHLREAERKLCELVFENA